MRRRTRRPPRASGRGRERAPLGTTLRPLLVALPVHLVVVAATWRDIDRRAPGGVRGNPVAWKVASAANTLGAAAYWIAGRR